MPESNRTFATLAEWSAAESIALPMESAPAFNAAVDRIIALLGDGVQVLGLGEPTHGMGAFLVLRNRIFKRLVEAHGYTAIAIESSFPRGRVVNDYIMGKAGDSFDVVASSGITHGFGTYPANRELIEWMHAYNASATAARRATIAFDGFDSPTEMSAADSPRQLLMSVLDFLAAVDGPSVEPRRQRLDELLGDDAAWSVPGSTFDASKSVGHSPAVLALRAETEDLITELEIRRPELIAASDASRYAAAVHEAALARRMLTYHAWLARTTSTRVSEALGLRDAIMADNLAFILARERQRTPAGKVFAFAHNAHLKRGQAIWQMGPNTVKFWPAGSHVAAMLGDRFAAIGVSLTTAADARIPTPEFGTIEHALALAGSAARFAVTRRGAIFDAGLRAAVPTRSMPNPKYFPFVAQTLCEFDGVIVIDPAAI